MTACRPGQPLRLARRSSPWSHRRRGADAGTARRHRGNGYVLVLRLGEAPQEQQDPDGRLEQAARCGEQDADLAPAKREYAANGEKRVAGEAPRCDYPRNQARAEQRPANSRLPSDSPIIATQ